MDITTGPFRLQRGGIYLLECEIALSAETLARLTEQLSAEGKQLGVTFVILNKGIRLARGKLADAPADSTKGDE